MSTQGFNIGITYGYENAENNWGATMNDSLVAIDVLSQIKVEKVTNTPQLGITSGEVYWIGSAGTGAWADKDNQLATWVSGQWNYYPVQKGWQIFNKETERLKVVSSDLTETGAYDFRPTKTVQEIDHTTTAIDVTDGKIWQVTLGGNWEATFTFGSNDIENEFTLVVIQDPIGSHTITWPVNVMWAGGTAPTLTGDASSIDVFKFVYDKTNVYGSTVGLDYSVPA